MSDFVCKKCGSAEYEIKDKPNGTGIAHGLYCAKCGFWHKWLNKDELKKITTIKPQEKCYSIDEVNHLIAEEDKLIQKLKTENAELRARLAKAVELKFKIGDTIYLIQRTAENPKGEVLEAKFIDYEARNNSLIYITIHGSTYFQFNEDYIGKLVFTDKSKAEARLAKLKGEEEQCQHTGV